jgi:predicted ATP-dependent serine protease
MDSECGQAKIFASLRVLIDPAGERGSGKSVLLFQSASYALESGWIVLYVPSGTSSSCLACFPSTSHCSVLH